MEQSAGNQIAENNLGSSETTRTKDHCVPQYRPPKHRYPQTDKQWGQFLSGLIDSDGYINAPFSQPKIVICFHEKDVSLAYKIKQFIKYGTVKKVSKKKAYNFTLTNKNGFYKLLPLITELKIKRKHSRYLHLCQYYNISLPENRSQKPINQSYWLAGFLDGDGYLKIYIRHRKDREKSQVLLSIVVELTISDISVLENIQYVFGGTLWENKQRKSVIYSSSSLTNFKKFVAYLDHYCLCSNKYKEYVIWRKAYFYRQDFLKIQRLYSSLKRLRRFKKK